MSRTFMGFFKGIFWSIVGLAVIMIGLAVTYTWTLDPRWLLTVDDLWWPEGFLLFALFWMGVAWLADWSEG